MINPWYTNDSPAVPTSCSFSTTLLAATALSRNTCARASTTVAAARARRAKSEGPASASPKFGDVSGGMETCVLGKGLVFLFKWYLWDIRKRSFGRIWAEHNGDISKIGDFTCWFKSKKTRFIQQTQEKHQQNWWFRNHMPFRNGDLLSSGKTSTLTWHQNIMVDTGPLQNELIITPNMLVESNPMQVHRSGFHNLWQTQRRSKTKCTTNV